MIAEFLLLAVLPLLLATAAFYDLASFTIPNYLQGLLVGGFAVFAIAAGLGAPAIGWHLLAGFIGLSCGFALFAMGYIGGGDAKLVAAVMLWLGMHDLMAYLLVTSVLGGALTLGLLTLRRLPLPQICVGQPWILRLHDAGAGIPYGVALAAGAFVILPGTEIFRLAAGG